MKNIAPFITEPLALILLIALGIQTIIATVTYIRFIGWVGKKLKIRSGHIIGRFVQSNRREHEKLVKVSGGKVSIKLPNAKNKSTFNFDQNKMTFKGNDPIQTFTVKSVAPVDISNPTSKSKVSMEAISNLIIRSFNLGLIASIKKDDILKLLIVAAVILALISSAVSVYNNVILVGWQEKMDSLPTEEGTKAAATEAVNEALKDFEPRPYGVPIPVNTS